MRKIIINLTLLFFVTGCAESVALLGPASTAFGGGNVIQSSVSSAVTYGVKKQTGKSPFEHIVSYSEKQNPERKKEKCVSFLESTTSEVCAIAKKRLAELKNKVQKSYQIQNLGN